MTVEGGRQTARRRWVRVAAFRGAPVRVTVDGTAYDAREGESVLSAVLAVSAHVRLSELDGTPRAGFCLMGACQDCWVYLDGNRRARACGTPVSEGLAITTVTPPVPSHG